MTCAHRLLDYCYGVWYRCRNCGSWVRRDTNTTTSHFDYAEYLSLRPFRFQEFPSRGHAMHGKVKGRDGSNGGDDPVPLI